MFCVEKGDPPKEAVRRTTQALWDCGLRVSPMTRAVGECERFNSSNAEFGLSVLDRRLVAGEASVFEKLETKAIAKMMARDGKAMRAELLALTRKRHAKYGETLFHLEPNIKDCPGGLRDAHVCEWLATIRWMGKPEGGLTGGEFGAATRFLSAVRCFLHYRHERDDNVLDWKAQDAAAAGSASGWDAVAEPAPENAPRVDGAYWMRAYFRHARVIERSMAWEMESAGLELHPVPVRKLKLTGQEGFRLRDGRIELDAVLPPGIDPAEEPEIVLQVFVAIARPARRWRRTARCGLHGRFRCSARTWKKGRVCGGACPRSCEESTPARRSARCMRWECWTLFCRSSTASTRLVIRDAYRTAIRWMSTRLC